MEAKFIEPYSQNPRDMAGLANLNASIRASKPAAVISGTARICPKIQTPPPRRNHKGAFLQSPFKITGSESRFSQPAKIISTFPQCKEQKNKITTPINSAGGGVQLLALALYLHDMQ